MPVSKFYKVSNKAKAAMILYDWLTLEDVKLVWGCDVGKGTGRGWFDRAGEDTIGDVILELDTTGLWDIILGVKQGSVGDVILGEETIGDVIFGLLVELVVGKERDFVMEMANLL